MGLDEVLPNSQPTARTRTQVRQPSQPSQPARNNGESTVFEKSPIQYVTPAQLHQVVNENSLAAPLLSAQIADLSAEYEALTGKKPMNMEAMIAGAVQAKQDFKTYAAQQLGLDELRKEHREKQMDAEIQRRVDAAVAQRISEGKVLGVTMGGRQFEGSPVVTELMSGPNKDAKFQRNPPGTAANKATQAYLSGKYSNGNNG